MTNETASSAATQRRILRRGEVEQRTGFKRSHIYKLIKVGQFPKPARTGKRAVGWDSAEVDQWIVDQLKNRL